MYDSHSVWLTRFIHSTNRIRNLLIIAYRIFKEITIITNSRDKERGKFFKKFFQQGHDYQTNDRFSPARDSFENSRAQLAESVENRRDESRNNSDSILIVRSFHSVALCNTKTARVAHKSFSVIYFRRRLIISMTHLADDPKSANCTE